MKSEKVKVKGRTAGDGGPYGNKATWFRPEGWRDEGVAPYGNKGRWFHSKGRAANGRPYESLTPKSRIPHS